MAVAAGCGARSLWCGVCFVCVVQVQSQWGCGNQQVVNHTVLCLTVAKCLLLVRHLCPSALPLSSHPLTLSCRYIDYMRLVLGSKARELYQSLDAVLEPPKPGQAAGQQVGTPALC
jgi:hypothetical protein